MNLNFSNAKTIWKKLGAHARRKVVYFESGHKQIEKSVYKIKKQCDS